MKSYIIKEDPSFSDKIEKLISANFSEHILGLFKNSQIVLVGNAIRHYFEGKEINFFDFFCFNKEVFRESRDIFTQNSFEIHREEDEFIIFKKAGIWVYMYIDSTAKNIVDMLENFGFSVDKIGYYKGVIIIHKRFFEDLEKKHMIYCGSNNPKISFSRIKMLKREEFTITKTDLDIMERDLDKIEF